MGKKRNYTQEDLKRAVAAVQYGMSYRKASKTFGVPCMTISDRVTGKSEGGINLGRPSALSASIEYDIARKLKAAAIQGFGVTRRQLVIKVARICKQLKIQNSFKNGVPGKGWISGFLRRHPDIKLRTPAGLSTVRARMLNPVVTKNYFDSLECLIDTLGLHDKPQAIWNIDETGVPLTHRPSKVFAETGVKNIPGRVGNDRDRVTALACINGAGVAIPPMAIVKGKTPKSLNAYSTKLGVPGTVYTYQERAWMEDTLGARWFEDHFLKHCGSERPQLIVLDSHSSHETLELLENAKANNIHLIAFPPHTTQWLCPLDKSIFGPFSREWNAVCTEYMSESPSNLVSKWEWPRLFNIAYSRAFTASNIISGFRKCGIVPVNANAIPSDAFAPSQPFDRPLATVAIPSTSSETPVHLPPSDSSREGEVSSASASDAVGSAAAAVTPEEVATRTSVFSPAEVPSTSLADELSLPVELPDGTTFLTVEDFVLSVLAGDVPSTFDESGNVIIEIETCLPSVPTTELEAVKEEFLLPVPEKTQNKSNPRKITSHRILTSENIIKIKREKAEEKLKTEALKKARKEQREARKKLKLKK